MTAKKDHTDWTTDLRRRMADYEAPPPEGLWTRIADALPQADAAPPMAGKAAARRRPKGRPLWPWAASGVAAAAVIALMVWWPSANLQPEGTAGPLAMETVPAKHTVPDGKAPAALSSRKAPASPGGESGGKGVAAAAPPRVLSSHMKGAPMAKAAAPVTGEAAPAMALMALHPTGATAENEVTTTDGAATPSSDAIDAVRGNDAAATAPHQLRAKRRLTATAHGEAATTAAAPLPATASPATPMAHRFALSAYTGGAMRDSKTTGYTRPLLMGSVAAGPAEWMDDPRLGLLTFNQGRTERHEVHHRMPVRAGFNVSYALSPRWALETGLTYTYLATDLTDGTEDNYSSGRQRLHYVGLPLRVRFRALSWHGLSAYAAGGLRVEKRIGASLERRYVVNGAPAGHETVRLGTHTVQIAADVALGVQYQFTPSISLYAEPAVACYADDRSAVRTFYGAHPITFDITAGLRLSLHP